MIVTWAVQTNLLNAPDVQNIRRACIDQEHHFEPLHVIPFSDDLPDVPVDVPTIFYGSARMTVAIARHGQWQPGVFFDDDAFSYTTYIEQLGAHMLNHDAICASIRQLAHAPPSQILRETTYFVRPNGDDKTFAGTLMTGLELTQWAQKLVELAVEMDLEAPVVIARPQEIQTEWRLFMCEDQVITASRYRTRGQLDEERGAPQDVVSFAQDAARLWCPARAHVMDVARLATGELRIIEFNGINSSGFYDASISDIVATLSALAQEYFVQNAST